MRLFVAIPLPVPVREVLKGSIREWKKGWPMARWTRPENWHVTLRFLGEVPDERLSEAQQWLLASLESARGGILRLGQPGFFDQRGRYVLWVGLEQAEWLAQLAARLQGVVAGVLPERRAFAAHLTVARVEVERREEERFAAFLKEFTASHLPPAAEPATEVVLYRSELAVKGAPYSVLATAFLPTVDPV